MSPQLWQVLAYLAHTDVIDILPSSIVKDGFQERKPKWQSYPRIDGPSHQYVIFSTWLREASIKTRERTQRCLLGSCDGQFSSL